MARVRLGFCSAAVMAASLAFAAHAGAGEAKASEAKGFAVTWFQPAMFTGEVADECPDGLNKSPDFKAIFAAEGKTAEQIKNLLPAILSLFLHRRHPLAEPDVNVLPGWSRWRRGFALGLSRGRLSGRGFQ